MISKQYRLNERELRKVLSKKKPFFSYGIIANTYPNTLGYNRCAILLSAKQTRGSVNRNFFRRCLYDTSRDFLNTGTYDVVFVPKKGTILNYKDTEQRKSFENDIQFLWKMIHKKKNPT